MAKATSGFQHSLWHQRVGDDVSFPGNTLAFCPFLSLALDSEGRSKQCGHPTSDKRGERTPGYRCCSVRGTPLLPKPPGASPKEDAYPKTGKCERLPRTCEEMESPGVPRICPLFRKESLLLCTWKLCSLVQRVNKQVI